MNQYESLVKAAADAVREYQRQPGVLNPEHGTLWIDHAEEPTKVILDAIPDGWAKVDGEWVPLDTSRIHGGMVL